MAVPRMHAPAPSSAPADNSSRNVPLEKIITDIAAMGFDGRHVMDVVASMQSSGKSVDLNAIIDRLQSR